MRRLTSLSLILPLLWAGVAAAQTSADLQAIGQAAAAQYGVPWNVFQAQIQAESSWNPNIGCNTAGACGIAQFIAGTAKQYGVNTNDVTSSLYGAAAYDAALYQQTGSWTGALTRYTGGLTPTNPGNASYATAFADAQAVDNGIVSVGGTPLANSTGTGIIPGGGIDPLTGNPITLGTGATLPGGATPTAQTVVEPPTFRAFSWVWSKYQTVIQQPLTGLISDVRVKAGGLYGVLALIAIAVTGIGLMLGLKTPSDFVRKALKIAIVGGIVGVAGLYVPYWVDLVNSIPGWLGQGLSLQGGAAGPAGGFDNIAATFLITCHAVIRLFPWLSGELFWDLVLLTISGVALAIPLIAMFAIWFSAQVVAQFLLIIGSLLALTLLSDYTEQIFIKYIHSFISLSAISFVAVVVAVLALKLMTQVFDDIPQTQTASAMASNLLEACLAIAAVACILTVLWVTVERFTGAAGAAHLAQNATNIVRQAGATVASAGAAAAAPAAAGTSNIINFRRSMPVGRSVSGGP